MRKHRTPEQCKPWLISSVTTALIGQVDVP